MKKVLMVGNAPSVKGGITSVISQLVDYDWQGSNIRMKFISTYIEGSKLKQIAYYCVAYVKILIALLLFRPDIVHIHMSYRGSFIRKYLIHKMCKMFRKEDIIHLHGSEFEKWYNESNEKLRKRVRSLLSECDYFIVLGEEWETKVKNIELDTNTVIVRNAVNIPLELSKQEDSYFKILFLGVLIKRKGIHDLLDAISLLNEKQDLTQVKVIIAGSGEEENRLKQYAKELKIEHIVEFTGWVNGEQKVKLLKTSQLLVLPSYNEGLPIAVLEALSYGIPVVATSVGDMASAVIEGENGYLVQPGDVTKLASDIGKVLEEKEKYILMRQEARRIAEEKFSDANYFKTIGSLYKSS